MERTSQEPRRRLRAFIVSVSLLAAFTLPLLIQHQMTRILPGVYIERFHVGGLTIEQAYSELQKNVSFEFPKDVVLRHDNETFATPSASLGLSRNDQEALSEAFMVGRKGGFFKRMRDAFQAFLTGYQVHLTSTANQDLIAMWVEQVSSQLNEEGVEPSVQFGYARGQRVPIVDEGKLGRKVDTFQLSERILVWAQEPWTASSQRATKKELEIPISFILPLTSEQIELVRVRATQIQNKSIDLEADGLRFILDDTDLLTFFSIPQGYNEHAIDEVIEQWAKEIDRSPQEPSMTVENGKVTAFAPPRYGRALNSDQAKELLFTRLKLLEDPAVEKPPTDLIKLSFDTVQPTKSLAETNELGIKERIGFAESYFYHSIPNRVHNVALTAQRMNLALIPPGETFSYNNTIGEVSARTGFRTAYVIQQGRTVLGDGGGVCQGSTTIFRTALNAGLPILARKGHSYRVSYYEFNTLPGIDATVYSPSVDFKFMNDTPAHILVTAEVDPKNYHMVIEFWGTSDGRVSEISDHIVYDKVPPRATVYQDDPSLPPGVLRQVDWSAPGAKASFHYKVTRNGETLQDHVFKTTYQPWAAVYLRGI
jgi:vancomycin resistance protein YoaR